MKMADYISRDDALLHSEIIRVYSKDYGNIDVVPVEYLADIPTADVQPVIHAHWRRGEEKGFKTYNPLWYCSNCGGQIRYDTRMRQYQKTKRPVWEVNAFCRKCGARMDLKDGDTNA